MLLRIVHGCTTNRALLPGGANRLCQRPLGPEPGSFPPPQEGDLNVTTVRSGVTATGYESIAGWTGVACERDGMGLVRGTGRGGVRVRVGATRSAVSAESAGQDHAV